MFERRQACRRASVVALALALLLYLSTMAPTITWQHDSYDAGDLIVAAHTLGISHPSGYPTYMLLGRCFTLLPFRDIAARTNLLSAVSAALCVALLCHSACQETVSSGWRWPGALVCALMLAACPLFWSQALVTEVYALNAFFHALLLCLAQRSFHLARAGATAPMGSAWSCLWWAALVLGIGLGNHLTLAFSAPLLLAAWYALIQHEASRGCHTMRAIALFLCGLSVYLYLPLRAGSQPLFNWGNPKTVDGFLWMLTGGIYRQYVAAIPLSEMPHRMTIWLDLLHQQFGIPGILLGILGTGSLARHSRLWLAGLTLSLVGLSVYAMAYNAADSYVYLLPVCVTWALLMAVGGRWLLAQLEATPQRAWVGSAILSTALLALALNSVRIHISTLSLRNDSVAHEYGRRVLAEIPDDSLLLAATDPHAFTLWYFLRVAAPRPRVALVDVDLIGYPWYADGLRLAYPWVNWPPPGAPMSIDQLIQLNAATLTTYLTDPVDCLMQDHVWEPKGQLLLWRPHERPAVPILSRYEWQHHLGTQQDVHIVPKEYAKLG